MFCFVFFLFLFIIISEDDDIGDACEVQGMDHDEMEDEESTPVAPPTPDAHLESTVVPYSDTPNVISTASVSDQKSFDLPSKLCMKTTFYHLSTLSPRILKWKVMLLGV